MISGCEKVIFAILLIMFFISSSSAAMFHPPEYEIHYDQNGNIIQEPGYHYEYNNFNKLTTIKNGTENGPTIYTFTYDENGQKIKQTQHQQNGQTKTTTYIDENYQTTTQENNTTTQTTIYANGKIIAKKTNNNTTYYLTDIRGSTTKTLNQQGQETTQNTYLPYGKTTNNPTTQHTYTGQEQTTNNLLYYNARNYNTLTKQFTQPDTITTNPHNPQNLNKYTYTNNNPIKYTDPSGHWAHIVVGGLLGGVIGGGANLIQQIINGQSLFDGTIDWGEVGIYAASGAAFGSVAAATGGLGVAAAGSGFEGYALGGAISTVSGGRASQLTHNLLDEDRAWNQDLLDIKSILIETAIGTNFGVLTKASSFFKPTIKPTSSVQNFPLKKLYGTHEIKKSSVVTPINIITGAEKGPVSVWEYNGKYIVSDGMGRSARRYWLEGKTTVPGILQNPSPQDMQTQQYAKYLYDKSNKESIWMQVTRNE
ncbi:MAG: hypothetical protein H6502_04285 [Candidatus Woesearchaeota archaeon]|nr:MAG: hypothetical protein H6502_04285 [Candidatus Woesearchaeota archaeon]